MMMIAHVKETWRTGNPKINGSREIKSQLRERDLCTLYDGGGRTGTGFLIDKDGSHFASQNSVIC